MQACACFTPTDYPAGSFREGSFKRRTITRNNRENRKKKSSLNGGRDGRRAKVIKQDAESKRNKEMEGLGKVSSESDKRDTVGESSRQQERHVQVRAETLVLNSDTFRFHCQITSFIPVFYRIELMIALLCQSW